MEPATVTVVSGPLASITVSPNAAILTASATQQFTAVGKDALSNVVMITPTWSVAIGGGTISSSGLFTAAASPGTSIVRATSGSIFGSATVAVITVNGGGRDAWTTKTPMPTPRAYLGVGVVNGILYAVGGGSGYVYLGTLEAYDPATNTWTTKAPMPTARGSLGVGVVNGILYAVGGFGGFDTPPYSWRYLGTLEAYDPATNTWTTKAPMPTARTGVGVGVVNGILYAVGGYYGRATVEAYDPATNTWTTKAPMPTARDELGVGVVNGVLYAVGGAGDVAGVRTVEVYDPGMNTWTTKAPMPTARWGVGVGVVNGILYAVGGGFEYTARAMQKPNCRRMKPISRSAAHPRRASTRRKR